MSYDMFQQKIDQLHLFQTLQKHDSNLLSLIEATKENGFIFNNTKFIVKTKSIKFFGGIYNKKGMRPNPPNVEDIKTLESPANEAELQHVLRMVTYMALFIPHLSEKRKMNNHG